MENNYKLKIITDLEGDVRKDLYSQRRRGSEFKVLQCIEGCSGIFEYVKNNEGNLVEPSNETMMVTSKIQEIKHRNNYLKVKTSRSVYYFREVTDNE